MSTLPMQQEDHPAYNLVGPSQDHRGKELPMPDLRDNSYSDKYDIMDNNKAKLNRPMPDRGN